jgi:hypothetical protein
MSKFTKIYLDMDGVIADFGKRYYELFHLTPKQGDLMGLFNEHFNAFIGSNHFSTLDMMPDAKILLEHLSTLDIPIEILSSTARQDRTEAISEQKRVWLISHGINYPRNFVPGKSLKYTFATPESIIIDDTLSVITDWTKAGGTAIHHTDAASTIASLDALLSA